jgi:hypothetical protein
MRDEDGRWGPEGGPHTHGRPGHRVPVTPPSRRPAGRSTSHEADRLFSINRVLDLIAEHRRHSFDAYSCGAVQIMKFFGALRRHPAGEGVKPPQAAWLETAVVSLEERAFERRQVGTGQASVSEPLTKCRKK